MKTNHKILVYATLFIFVALSPTMLHSEDFVCPKAELKDAPRWFLTHPQVNITVTVNSIRLECEGLPLEVNVPDNNVVRISVTRPKDYTCSAIGALSPLNRPNAIKEVIDLVKGVGPFLIRPSLEGPDIFILPSDNRRSTMAVTIKCHSRPPDTQADIDTELRSEANNNTPTPPPAPAASQKIVINYGPPSRVSASAGFILAGGVRSYGVKVANLGNVGGVATIQSKVAITSSPSAQVVPFAFTNVYLRGSPKTHIDLQFGVGLNPNLSSTKLEFFASPLSLSWHDVYFSPGIHIGQHENLANGFAVGDIVPNGSKVPTSFKYFGGFGFSVSYNLHPVASAIGSK